MNPIKQHPLRDVLEQELQQRVFPPIEAPCRISHWMFTLSAASRSTELQLLQQIAAKAGVTLPETALDVTLQFADLTLHWQRHSEFSSYSFIRAGTTNHFDNPQLDLPTDDWFSTLPGQLFRLVQLQVVTGPLPPALAGCFVTEDCISSLLAQGQARVWTDFRKHPEGAGRMLLWTAEQLNAAALARLVQQLFDLGNYRKLALLAWPPARQALTQLHQLEQQLAGITEQIERQQTSDQWLLQQICLLSAQTEHLIASNSARLDACHAYYQLVLDRLKTLQEQPVDGMLTLKDFSERRLTPAWRTAGSVQRRQLNLSSRLGRSTELLRTRINLQLERQNNHLLASMEQRARLQLGLQRAVERVSVVAISYYAVQLCDKALLALTFWWPALPLKQLQSFSLPLVVLLVSFVLYRLHRQTLEPKPPSVFTTKT